MKKIQAKYPPPPGHWVGDGFPVRSLFSYDRMGARRISPFLLLDYAGPAEFAPAARPRGVGEHPHKGFETVTIVYQGELEHRDSSGGGGSIGVGDVQWMTAGAGIVHEEFHSRAFTSQGGMLEMVQLWVNLPSKHKETPPAYQTLLEADIPRIQFEHTNGELRVIAGQYQDHRGPARTFTPINVWDGRLASTNNLSLQIADRHVTLLICLEGTLMVNRDTAIETAHLLCFDETAGEITLEAETDSRFLVLTGEPIDEPVKGYGPFVMNTHEEIQRAIVDYKNGKFGAL
jgi:redox-sensitive bicupin YhaK (pirin superfamily)